MSSVSNASDLTQLEECFQQKLSSLQISKDIRGGWEEDTIVEFVALSNELQAIRQEVLVHKETVSQARTDIAAAYALLKQVQNLSSTVTHMRKNLPSHLPTTTSTIATNPAESTANKKSNKENVVPSGKANSQEKGPGKTGSGKTKPIPTIQYITTEEFDTVSKYIKGRLQYEQVNHTVDELNKTIETKYNLMARPRAKLSEFDMKNVIACRQQENQETKGFHFVVDSDIKRWSGMKLDTAGRSMLTVLRTLKRLREIRGPGNLIRYAVV